ncbi:MAG TPA: hypothetical protein VKT82_08795 [Ktedonobacterales bacterium]|nr:hypothetical protein [Ktedonobacterales bacterium]
MPLDSRKATHIASVVPKTWAGRQKTVTLVTESGGTQSYSAVAVIFRPMAGPDPTVADATGQPPKRVADTLMLAPTALSLAGVIFVADTPTATSGAVAAAPKYEIIDILPAGMLPGGTHQRVLLRRLR